MAALTEVGYNPDVKKLEQSHTPWAYYMTWSQEFCMDGVYNTVEKVKEMYDSEIKAGMMKKFGYKNEMQIPKLVKIVVVEM